MARKEISLNRLSNDGQRGEVQRIKLNDETKISSGYTIYVDNGLAQIDAYMRHICIQAYVAIGMCHNIAMNPENGDLGEWEVWKKSKTQQMFLVSTSVVCWPYCFTVLSQDCFALCTQYVKAWHKHLYAFGFGRSNTIKHTTWVGSRGSSCSVHLYDIVAFSRLVCHRISSIVRIPINC